VFFQYNFSYFKGIKKNKLFKHEMIFKKNLFFFKKVLFFLFLFDIIITLVQV